MNIGVYASRSSITLLRFKVPLPEKYMLPFFDRFVEEQIMFDEF